MQEKDINKLMHGGGGVERERERATEIERERERNLELFPNSFVSEAQHR